MALLARITLSALFLVSTPGAATPCNPCAVATGQVVSAGAEMVFTSGAPGAHPRVVQRDPVRDARCIAAVVDENDRLVALHRSIRDGGLGVLRTPTHAFGSATTPRTSNPAGCDAG